MKESSEVHQAQGVSVELARAKVIVRDIVQGLGFRPFIYLLANELKLSGWVLNSTEGVFIEVEGSRDSLEKFIADIQPKASPLVVIEEGGPGSGTGLEKVGT